MNGVPIPLWTDSTCSSAQSSNLYVYISTVEEWFYLTLLTASASRHFHLPRSQSGLSGVFLDKVKYKFHRVLYRVYRKEMASVTFSSAHKTLFSISYRIAPSAPPSQYASYIKLRRKCSNRASPVNMTLVSGLEYRSCPPRCNLSMRILKLQGIRKQMWIMEEYWK